MNRVRTLLVALFLSTSLSSCATIYTRSNDTPYNDDIYRATQQDAEWVNDEAMNMFGRIIMLADFPFSIVSDTIMLPFDW